jgi:hypothetical protein
MLSNRKRDQGSSWTVAPVEEEEEEIAMPCIYRPKYAGN